MHYHYNTSFLFIYPVDHDTFLLMQLGVPPCTQLSPRLFAIACCVAYWCCDKKTGDLIFDCICSRLRDLTDYT